MATSSVQSPVRPTRSFSLRRSIYEATPKLPTPRPKNVKTSKGVETPHPPDRKAEPTPEVPPSGSVPHPAPDSLSSPMELPNPPAAALVGPVKEKRGLRRLPSYKSRNSPAPSADVPPVPNVTIPEPMQPKIKISAFSQQSKVIGSTEYRRDTEDSSVGSTQPESRSRSLTDGIATLARRPWNHPGVTRSRSSSSSRSPSSRDDRSARGDGESSTAASSISSTGPADEDSAIDSSVGGETRARASSIGPGKKSRISMFTRSGSGSSSAQSEGSMSIVTPPKKVVKDELWEAYKMLESDYQKFQSKSNVQKTNIVRQGLLPFLRRFKDQSSRNLVPEELERRTRTLHRWWTGLLAQLKSRNTQAISGTDKPAYLEAISYIISRPEWRTAPSTFAPLADRSPLTAKSTSSSSLASTASTYSLQKSVQHNIKVLFTRTLSETLSFVVERMGFRTAPSTIVAFAGKVLAYAFFFCAGVADVLVSLWDIPPSLVRRVLPEFGIGRNTNLRDVTESIICDFPETLQSLGFSSLRSTLQQLKTPAKPPLGYQVDWNGAWTTRWRGADSDLLFVFFKQYHILLCEYLPPDPSLPVVFCSPGYVPILAQMLMLIDATIHRPPHNAEVAASTTFEELLNATAALPLPVRNTPRTMAENKLMVLLRDIISDVTMSESCRDAYISSFVAMLKAGVQRTQLYDADACFQLCDLMEELLPIFATSGGVGAKQYIDWDYWLKVPIMMLQSENNMTELRVIALIYTIYPELVSDEYRRKIICLEWLLSVPIWERFFCHWCPMVRAYYLRLICWRVARYDGEASELDTEIYKTILLRLRTGYAYHLRLQELGKISSTAPCLPAPSRRLVILRNDMIANPQGVLLDGIIPTSLISHQSLLGRSQSSTSLASLSAEAPPRDSAESNTRPEESAGLSRRWTAIRNVFGFSKSAAAPESAEPAKTAPQRGPPSTSSSEDPPQDQPQKKATFKFSLEWLERPMFGRERILGPARLAAATHRYLESRPEGLEAVEVPTDRIGDRHWTYVGRSLAEWVLVIVEYENFFDRRKLEGCETDKDVETPSLVVDSLRKF